LSRSGRAITVSHAALAALEDYRWPGNIRELQNVVEQMVARDRGGRSRRGRPSVHSGLPELSTKHASSRRRFRGTAGVHSARLRWFTSTLCDLNVGGAGRSDTVVWPDPGDSAGSRLTRPVAGRGDRPNIAAILPRCPRPSRLFGGRCQSVPLLLLHRMSLGRFSSRDMSARRKAQRFALATAAPAQLHLVQDVIVVRK
jgi:hypothetical protein